VGGMAVAKVFVCFGLIQCVTKNPQTCLPKSAVALLKINIFERRGSFGF